MKEPGFSEASPTISLRSWFLFALATRFLASMTHSHWFHPDEWCQTFEPATIIAHGFGVHSQEIGLHLRNLTWPVLLAGILKVTHFLWPSSIDLRVFSVNLLSGLLDLLIFWGWTQLLAKDPIAQNISSRTKSWSYALLLLSWFSIYEAVSPRAEHLSEIAFWAALGCIANSYWLLAGFASVAIAAFRYPSLLLTGTIVIFIFWKSRANFGRFLGGILLGLLVFGSADAAIYGRPWESFWMYLQYNLLTGSATQVFGKKGVAEYLEFFSWNWRTYPILLPLGFTLLGGSFYGFWLGLKRAQLWTFCLVVYLIGHFLVPHKEGRFMLPIETLLLWAAFLGMGVIFSGKAFKKYLIFRKALWTLLLFSGLANCGIFLHALRADLWKNHGTYRELGSHLTSSNKPGNHGICAVLTAGEISSIMIPLENSGAAPSPSFGTLSLERDRRGYSEMRNSEIIWFEHAPQCNSQHILLHTHKRHPGWVAEGCTLLPTGLLRILPPTAQDWILQQGYRASAWYNCPASILDYFGAQKIHQIYTHKFSRIENLPGLGTTAKELEDLGHQTSPPPRDIFLPTLNNPSAIPDERSKTN